MKVFVGLAGLCMAMAQERPAINVHMNEPSSGLGHAFAAELDAIATETKQIQAELEAQRSMARKQTKQTGEHIDAVLRQWQ